LRYTCFGKFDRPNTHTFIQNHEVGRDDSLLKSEFTRFWIKVGYLVDQIFKNNVNLKITKERFPIEILIYIVFENLSVCTPSCFFLYQNMLYLLYLMFECSSNRIPETIFA